MTLRILSIVAIRHFGCSTAGIPIIYVHSPTPVPSGARCSHFERFVAVYVYRANYNFITEDHKS